MVNIFCPLCVPSHATGIIWSPICLDKSTCGASKSPCGSPLVNPSFILRTTFLPLLITGSAIFFATLPTGKTSKPSKPKPLATSP